jgi:adenine-specific DNA-methyltransferase
VHEHVLIYAGREFGFIGPDAGPGKFRLRPEFGDVPVRLDPITKSETFRTRPNTYYPVQNEKTGLWYPCAPNQVWRFWSETKPPRVRPREASIEELIRNEEIFFPQEPEPPFFLKRERLWMRPSRRAMSRETEGDAPCCVPIFPMSISGSESQ